MNTAADTGSAHHHYMSIDQMYKCNVYTKWITVYSRIWCMYHTYIPVLLCKVGDILPKAYILTVIMSHFDNNTNYTIRIFHDCSLRLCFFTVLKMIMYKILQKISANLIQPWTHITFWDQNNFCKAFAKAQIEKLLEQLVYSSNQ